MRTEMTTEETDTQQAAGSTTRGERRRVLGLLDVTLFTVSAMLVAETLTAWRMSHPRKPWTRPVAGRQAARPSTAAAGQR
jgi:hypothetical protein